MIFGTRKTDRPLWRPFFAWRPVHLRDGRWVWLQRVERRTYAPPLGHVSLFDPLWIYRLPGGAEE